MNNNYTTGHETCLKYFNQNQPLHRHPHMFFEESSPSSSSSLLSHIIFENGDNVIFGNANPDTIDTELCLSSKRKSNKTKTDPWGDQQTQILTNMWEEYQRFRIYSIWI